MSVVHGYLGIDNGTQGLSILFTDEDLQVVATGEGKYDFCPNLPEGCYEQETVAWDRALTAAMQQISEQLEKKNKSFSINAIGISGQMHGEVLAGDSDASATTRALAPVRLWCDARNTETGEELTKLFGTKVPKRSTCARFLWTIRNRPELASKTKHMTTPAGWCAYRLTGEWNLGIGDASGMFPIDSTTLTYDSEKLCQFDALSGAGGDQEIPSLASILPVVKCAGQDAGCLTAEGAALLGLDEAAIGIPVAPAEGDQVAALAGSLIAKAGTISLSFGTSVCANVVGDRPFQGVSQAIDQFCAADGAPVNMVWLRNGTTFLNTIVQSYSSDEAGSDAFARVMPKLLESPADCGGLLALPFMDDEPGLEVRKGGSALILGWNPENSKPGNVAKAALLSTIFNLKLGCGVLDRQGYPRRELVLTGGLSKTPGCGQILADVFDTPVSLFAAADEGCSWGAAVLAKYRHLCKTKPSVTPSWPSFLESILPEEGQIVRFEPISENVQVYERVFRRYQELIKLSSKLEAV